MICKSLYNFFQHFYRLSNYNASARGDDCAPFGKTNVLVIVNQLRNFNAMYQLYSFLANKLFIKTNSKLFGNDGTFHLPKPVPLNQWFSTFSLKGVKSRLTTLLEGRTKEILTEVN